MIEFVARLSPSEDAKMFLVQSESNPIVVIVTLMYYRKFSTLTQLLFLT